MLAERAANTTNNTNNTNNTDNIHNTTNNHWPDGCFAWCGGRGHLRWCHEVASAGPGRAGGQRTTQQDGWRMNNGRGGARGHAGDGG